MGNKNKLTKRNSGIFTANEIAFFGLKDSFITDFLQKINKKLQKKWKTDFFTNSNNLRIKEDLYHSQLDFLLLNGSYFPTVKQQILVLTSDSEDLLLQNLEYLTNVQFVIRLNANAHFPDYLLVKYPTISNVISYDFKDLDSICNHIENLIFEKIAPINSLILIGGKSTRMGTDKSMLDYHGKPHREFLKDILGDFILKNDIFYSLRDVSQIKNTQIITDKFTDLGPFGGICSAFMYNPNKAWLVVATDLPFINKYLIQKLIYKRNPSKIATAFIGKNKDFPEPLITIWEPKAYPVLLQQLSRGELSLIKTLKNNEIELIEVDNSLIKNVNTKEEYEKIKKELTK